MTDEVWERYLDQQLAEAFGAEAPHRVRERAQPRLRGVGADAAPPRPGVRVAALIGIAVTVAAAFLIHGDDARVPGQGRGIPEVRTRAQLAALPVTTQAVRIEGLTDPDLEGLERLQQLRKLELRATTSRRVQLTVASLQRVAQLPKLEELRLDLQRGIDSDLAPLRRLSRLHTLCLEFTSVDDAALKVLRELPSLRVLDLSECRNVTEAGIEHVAACAGLQKLGLRSMAWLDPASLASLGALRELRELDLSGVDGRQKWYDGKPRPGGSVNGVTDEVLAAFGKLERLEVLRLAHDAAITDDGLAALGGLESLRVLDVRYCKLLSDRGLAALPEGIQTLILQGTMIEGTALGRFAALRELHLGTCRHLVPAAIDAVVDGPGSKTLESLQMSNCPRLSAASLARVVTLPRLHTLSLTFSQWLADEHLALLAPMRGRLRRLELAENKQLTAAALDHLKGFELLRDLDVEGVPIPAEALETLRRRHPALRIVTDASVETVEIDQGAGQLRRK